MTTANSWDTMLFIEDRILQDNNGTDTSGGGGGGGDLDGNDGDDGNDGVNVGGGGDVGGGNAVSPTPFPAPPPTPFPVPPPTPFPAVSPTPSPTTATLPPSSKSPFTIVEDDIQKIGYTALIIIVIVVTCTLWRLIVTIRKRREHRRLQLENARADVVLGDMQMVPHNDEYDDDDPELL